MMPDALQEWLAEERKRRSLEYAALARLYRRSLWADVFWLTLAVREVSPSLGLLVLSA
jgi:hypothetical protein